MPLDFPHRGPIFRVIAPRFKDVQNLNLSLSQNGFPDTAPLTMSRHLEHEPVWDPTCSMSDLAGRLRLRLETAEVDLEVRNCYSQC